MKRQLRFGAIFNPDPPQVQCSGWCYSEAEADTGKWKHSLGNFLLCGQNWKIHRFWFSPPIVYNYAWTIEKFSRICASYKPGKTMYSDQFVVMVNGRETRLQPSWIVLPFALAVQGGDWRCTQTAESSRTQATSHFSSKTPAGLWLIKSTPISILRYRWIRFSPANVRAHVKFSVVDVRGDHTNSKVRRPNDCLYVSNLGSRFFL